MATRRPAMRPVGPSVKRSIGPLPPTPKKAGVKRMSAPKPVPAPMGPKPVPAPRRSK